MAISVSEIPKEVERAIEKMPPISPIIGKINQIAHEIETSPKELVKIIMLDPVLTGKVIKLVNSSFYGVAERVQSLPQAVILLGVNTVKNLAVSTALLGTISVKKKQSPLNLEEFWKHCLASAVGCKLLGKALNVPNEDMGIYFVAGLLHDIGKILFIRINPEKYSQVLEECRQFGIALSFSEIAHFGCSHTHVGGLLAKKWRLDNALIDSVESHHLPAGDDNKLITNVVTIINNLCKRFHFGESGDPLEEEIAADLIKKLNISSDTLIKISDQLPFEINKAVEFLNIIQEHKI
jgi:putative nucleotidyltransferase with HDIG domain